MKHIILIVLLFFATVAAGQPGNIDINFGHHILAETRFGSSYFDEITALAIQPDGKILAAGYSRLSLDFLVLARFNINGTLDSTFGNNGQVMINPNDDEYYVSLLIQNDGKIILAGSGSFTGADSIGFIAVRINTNGTLDSTFGENGFLSTMFPNIDLSSEEPICVAGQFQPDGKILLAGDTFNDNSSFSHNINFTRYSPDGKADISFGTSGIITIKLGYLYSDIRSMVVQSDGKIILAGSINNHKALFRFSSDGKPDSLFGNLGISISNEIGIIKCINYRPDGKIITLEEIDDSISHNAINFRISRYNNDGSIDRSFAIGGSTNLVKDNSEGATLTSFVVLADGTIIAIGKPSYWTTNTSFLIMHYSADGIFSPGYSLSDLVETPSSFVLTDNSMVIEPDGKILIGGEWYNNEATDPSFIFGIKRFNIDGTLDNSFTSHPAMIISSAFRDDESTSISISPGKSILLGGYSDMSLTNSDLAAIRYNFDGSVDEGFWTIGDGKMYLPDSLKYLMVSSCINKSASEAYFAGNIYDPIKLEVKFAILTYNTTILSEVYSSSSDFGNGSNYCQSMLQQPDGKFILSGYAFIDRNYDFALLRYNKNLSALDSTFGKNGKVTTDLQGNQDYAYASALQTDGKIILAGTSYNGKQWDFALVRYNSDGSLDRSFGDTGVVLTAIHDSDDCAKAVQVQKDGKIVVAGFTRNQNTYNVALIRYNGNGSLDPTFGTSGIVETPIGNGDAKANGMVIQSNGKIVITGYSSNGKDDDFMVACYNPSGYLDYNFGTGGITTTDYGFGDDHANALALQSDGSIVVAGYAFNGTDKDYAVARYLPDLSLGVIDRKSSQNMTTIYPNPIQHSAKVEYELTHAQPISIKLFDVLGNERATFINHEMRTEGKNTEQINLPNGLPSGSYYLLIETAEGSMDVKIIKQ